MKTKTCTKCKEEKNLSAFNKKISTRDGYSFRCRDCISVQRKEERLFIKSQGIIPRADIWQKENRGYLNKQRTAKRRATRDYLRSLRTDPCMDCGNVFPSESMDWDHRDPSTKSFDICQEGIREHYSQKKLLSEIAKCDLICANCHRLRTEQQRVSGIINWGDLSDSPKEVKRRAKRKEIRDFLRSLKENQPCTDCGNKYPPTCMDWDHLDSSQKEFNICNDGINRMYSKERLLAEIAKCEIVCYNCHRVRTTDSRDT